MPPEAWAEVDVNGHLTLIYGPRVGRLYLLPSEQAGDPRFQRVVGLAGVPRLAGLADPVERIVHDLADLGEDPVRPVPRGLGAGYRLLSASRSVLPLRAAARVVRAAGARARGRIVRTQASASEIGRLVHGVEHRLGAADCYPRALITAFLCIAAGRSCSLMVGVLAPTRKMHAWCSVDGELPYEPMPEHYLYRPVWMLALSP